MVRRCGFALLFLALLSVRAYADSPIGTCEPDRGEQYPYLDTVSIQDKEVVLVGRGLIAEMLVYVDGGLVNVTSSHTNELRFPFKAYPGTKVLPADVEIYVQTRDLKRSNICTLKYPGYFPMLLGAASGLSNRGGAPAAMALGFIGLRGSVQERPPGDFLHQLFIVGGITKVANTEGPGFTLGVALRLGDIKLLYACRFNEQDYHHHIIGVAGTIKIADLIPK